MKIKTIQIVTISLLVALSIVFGKVLSFTADPFRISFENLPIVLSGILFGPIVGAFTGGISDLLGCTMVGYAINPIITLGSISVGAISGFIYKKKSNLFLSVATAHLVGSLLVKSIGLYVFYLYPIKMLLLRIPLYLVIIFLEYLILKKLFPIFKNLQLISHS